jgi:hypothetical protein
VRKQMNYCCRHVTIPVILLHFLHSLVCKAHCLMKRSFQGWLSAVPMQPSFCEFATFTWRHLAGPQRRCHHIVLFKVCHHDNTLNRTKSRVCGLQSHAKRPLCSSTTAFFRTMPAATSLCLSWKFWHGMQTWNPYLSASSWEMIEQENPCFSLWEATLGCAILVIVCIDGIGALLGIGVHACWFPKSDIPPMTIQTSCYFFPSNLC